MKNATRVFASTFGVIMAIAGMEHGIGEIFQGKGAPGGIMIQSWPESAFFHNMGGEPAMTILPNFLLTGILAVIVSLVLLIWSALFVQRKNGGWIMIALSSILLLVGGGIFPPVFGILIGVIAIRIHRPAAASKAFRTNGFQSFLATLWPFAYAACILAWLSVMPIGYFFGENHAEIILIVLLIALGTMVLTVVSGFAKDTQTLARNSSNSQDPDTMQSQSPAGKPSTI